MNRPTSNAIQRPGACALASFVLLSLVIAACGRAPTPAVGSARPAPPTTRIGLQPPCIRQPPRVSLSPPTTIAQPAGTVVAFDLMVTNQDSASCPAGDFEFLGGLPSGLTGDSFGLIAIVAGQTVHRTVNVTSVIGGPTGPLPFQFFVFERAGSGPEGFEQATYVVAPPPEPHRPPPAAS